MFCSAALEFNQAETPLKGLGAIVLAHIQLQMISTSYNLID